MQPDSNLTLCSKLALPCSPTWASRSFTPLPGVRHCFTNNSDYSFRGCSPVGELTKAVLFCVSIRWAGSHILSFTHDLQYHVSFFFLIDVWFITKHTDNFSHLLFWQNGQSTTEDGVTNADKVSAHLYDEETVMQIHTHTHKALIYSCSNCNDKPWRIMCWILSKADWAAVRQLHTLSVKNSIVGQIVHVLIWAVCMSTCHKGNNTHLVVHKKTLSKSQSQPFLAPRPLRFVVQAWNLTLFPPQLCYPAVV